MVLANAKNELDARWRAAGICHVLSVSGLHLAVVAGLLYWLLRKALAASPLGGRIRPARWAAPIAFAIALAYTAIIGAQLATLRALIVVGVMFLGAMLDRPTRLADALAAAALLILVWRPGDLFDPGFPAVVRSGARARGTLGDRAAERRARLVPKCLRDVGLGVARHRERPNRNAYRLS